MEHEADDRWLSLVWLELTRWPLEPSATPVLLSNTMPVSFGPKYLAELSLKGEVIPPGHPLAWAKGW